MDCIFCKIIASEIPSYKLYEDELVLVFLDVNPDSNGHTLIIPKKHYQDLEDIPEDVLTHIMHVAKSIKGVLEEKLKISGLSLIQNNGSAQEIKHYHLHLKPYYIEEQPKLSVEEVYHKIKES